MITAKKKKRKYKYVHYIRTKSERKDTFLEDIANEVLYRPKTGRKKSADLDNEDLSFLDDAANPLDNLESMEIDEDMLTASICRDSFYEFLKEFWSEMNSEVPVWNWHIEYLCNMLQEAAEKVMKGVPCEGDIIINIPPGTTKSSIVSVAFPAWVWTKMGHARFCCINHTYSLATDLARLSRDIIKSDKYRKLFPEIRIREDVDRQTMFVNNKKGYRYSIGSLASVIGKHFHFILVDDPIDPEAALSETEMYKINKFLSETVDSRKTDKAITLSVLVMQRLHEEDPTGDKISRDPDVRRFVLPADIADSKVAALVHPPELKRYYKDGLLDPIRLSRKILEKFRRKGILYFSGQFDQSPEPVGGGMFNTSALRMMTADLVPTEWVKLVRYWDKAATSGGGAFSVGVLMGLDKHNRYWILDVARGQWDSGTREDMILGIAREDGLEVMVGLEQEGGSGGKESVEKTIGRLAGFITKVETPKGDKVVRADPFSCIVNGGGVYILKGMWNKPYIDEMKHFPLSRYKDQIDASSGAFTVITKPTWEIGIINTRRRSKRSKFKSTPTTAGHTMAQRNDFMRRIMAGRRSA